MSINNFHNDLAKSEVGVNKLVQILADKGAKDIELCTNKDFDVAYTNSLAQRVTIEVKEDFLYKKTGNVAIEFAQWDKPTGISSSIADFYVYKLSNDFFSIKRESLQAKISKSIEAKETRTRSFADKQNPNKKIDVYLIPAPVFTSWCKQINQ